MLPPKGIPLGVDARNDGERHVRDGELRVLGHEPRVLARHRLDRPSGTP